MHHAPIPSQSVFSRPAALIAGGVAVLTLSAIATTLTFRAAPPLQADLRGGTASSSPAAPAQLPADRELLLRGAAPKPAHVQRGSVKSAEAGTRTAAACANCGKVESVSAVQHKGEGTGLGATGGAVLGGVLGHQVGGGSGKKLATVLGAVGGGFAGHEVEKQARATTVYEVRVRMDDGSLRTLTQSTAPAVGQKVTVEGSTLRTRASAS